MATIPAAVGFSALAVLGVNWGTGDSNPCPDPDATGDLPASCPPNQALPRLGEDSIGYPAYNLPLQPDFLPTLPGRFVADTQIRIE